MGKGKEKAERLSNRTVARAAGWSFAAEIVAKMVAPIINMILARILAPQVFGIVATVMMVVSLSEIFTEAGFQLYIIQHEFDSKEELYQYASTALWTSIAIGIIIFIFTGIFRNSIATYVGSPGYGSAVFVASASIPITAAISILQAQYRRNFDYKPLFIRRIVVAIVPIIITVPLALLGAGIWALIIGTICQNIINVLLLLGNKEYHPGLFFRISYVKKMAPFCLTTMITYLLSWAINWLDIFIVSNILGSYYTGLYKNSQATVNGILSIITSALMPIVFNLLCRYQDDHEKFYQVMVEYTQKLSLFIIPLGFGIFSCRRLLTTILLGNKWMEAADFIGIWGLCTVFSAVYATYCREGCRALGKPHLNVIAQLLSLVVILPASYFSAKAGFNTMIYWRSLAMLSLIVFYYIIYYFKLRMNPLGLVKVTLEPIFASIIMSIGIFFSNKLSDSIIYNFGVIVVSIFVYFGVLCIFPEKRRLIINFLHYIKNKIIKNEVGK